MLVEKRLSHRIRADTSGLGYVLGVGREMIVNAETNGEPAEKSENSKFVSHMFNLRNIVTFSRRQNHGSRAASGRRQWHRCKYLNTNSYSTDYLCSSSRSVMQAPISLNTVRTAQILPTHNS